MDDMDNDYEFDKVNPDRQPIDAKDEPEPMDFENNGVLWLPPEPEDEEDEREALLFDDDDDDVDAAGEWGYLRSFSTLGREDCGSRDKSNEEHKKAM
nr:1-phosphatidylinositol-3-phosphate 5-kinase FAB1B-like [Tanacetum cinerariifolium]